MDIYLIRHGETPMRSKAHYNAEKRTADPPLTEKGVEQARLLSQRLADVPFDRIVSSDLARAVKTARILAENQSCKVETDPRLREIDMGALYQRVWADFPAERAEFLKHERDVPYPGGECGADVWRRASACINEIRQRGGSRVALVCHGGVIRSVACGILRIPQERRFFFGDPPINCSITIVRFSDGGCHLHTFNDYSHLGNFCE
jgi:probable phosphoglycerate mutase